MKLGILRKLAVPLAAAASLLLPSPSWASSATGGKVTNLTIAQDGVAWFTYTGTLQGSLPSCAEANGLWIITPSQTGYQGLLAGLLSAQARGAQVSIQGTAECGTTTHERIAYMVIVN